MFCLEGVNMNLIVQKFGGSSVADAGKLLHISQIVKPVFDAGKDVIVVVSAQGDTTDVLMKKARELDAQGEPRELDALLSAGEQASAALMALALCSRGIPAVSLNAWQLPVQTDSVHGDARILEIGRQRVLEELRKRRVVVVTGFQGVNAAHDITTLGRGGSDYSAVALAAAFGAEECRIYTDVDGVYTADPRLCPTARRLERVSFEDMYALSRAGAQVLHDKCVALAQEKGVEPEVRSCLSNAPGTRIGPVGTQSRVTGVTRRLSDEDPLAAVTLVGRALPSLEMEKDAIAALCSAEIDVEGIDADARTLTLYVARKESQRALCVVHDAFFRN